jgi:hypothetical protein
VQTEGSLGGHRQGITATVEFMSWWGQCDAYNGLSVHTFGSGVRLLTEENRSTGVRRITTFRSTTVVP